nr:sugar transferase [Bifidobacterium boum]
MATPVRQVQTKPARQEAANAAKRMYRTGTGPTSPSHSTQESPMDSQYNETSFFDGTYFAPDAQGILHRTGENIHQPLGYTVPKWRYVYNAALIALDTVMVLFACCIVFLFNHPGYETLLRHHGEPDGIIGFLLIVCVANLVCLYLSKSYERHTMGEGYELYTKLINAQLLNFVVLCTVTYIFKMGTPRAFTFAIPPVALVLLVIERYLMRLSLHRNRRNGEYNYPTVIVGSPEGIRHTIADLESNNSLGYKPIAICPVASMREEHDPDSPQHLVSVPFHANTAAEHNLVVLPLNSHLPQAAKKLNAQTVLISDVLTRDSETMRTLSLAVESMGIELALTTKVADIGGATLHMRGETSLPVLTASLPQYSLKTRICKRFFDIILSSAAIIVSSPIMAYVAFRVHHEDGGPAIYTQQRIGLYGKPFTLYKFRSMRVNADKEDKKLAEQMGADHGILFKAKDDPRITKFGHFIRKTSLDEFPQFFNVFKGDMSMVGPRPQQQYEVDEYNSLYSTRLLVKPGITGPWQVSGRSDLSQEESERLDVSYVENWSLTADIAIMFKTVSAVLRGTGSY